jgi:hypothetical protein
MRNRDPRDDPPTKRRPQPYRGAPVTLGHIRSHGVRHLLIYCSTGRCHHSAVINADCWPDETTPAGLGPEGGLHQVRDDRRGRAAQLERAIRATEPRRRA